MPVNSQWLLRDQVLFMRFSGHVRLEDIAHISENYTTWAAQNPKPAQVHFIMDTLAIKAYPREVEAIRTRLTRRMDRIGWMLFVTDDFYIEHLGGIFGRMLGFSSRTCASVLEGYRFLQDQKQIDVPEHWPASIDDTMPKRPFV